MIFASRKLFRHTVAGSLTIHERVTVPSTSNKQIQTEDLWIDHTSAS